MPETADPIVATALAELDAGGDPQRALAQLSFGPDAGGAMVRFAEAAKLLYAPRRNLAAMIAVGQGGMAFGVDAAKRPRPADEAAQIRLAAMRLGYNVAANCWPGWGDEGVDPTRDQIDAALAMAEHSLELRGTLEFARALMDRGHWLVGALLMALGRNAEAAAAFERGEDASDAGGKDAEVLMARSYRGLALKRDPATRERGAALMDAALAALEQSTAKDAAFYIAQVQNAERLLS